jgi:hypothetical protein
MAELEERPDDGKAGWGWFAKALKEGDACSECNVRAGLGNAVHVRL